MKTLAIFCGSKEFPSKKIQKLDDFLVEFFSYTKGRVSNIIYGGGRQGIMGQVFDYCHEFDIPLTGHILEKYKRPTDPVGSKYFANHTEQVLGFVNDSDAFLALPGGIGTVREVLEANELIKITGKNIPIYIPPIFTAFYKMIEELDQDGMVADEDMGNIIKLDKIETMRI